mgnify:CR=1 FL=1
MTGFGKRLVLGLLAAMAVVQCASADAPVFRIGVTDLPPGLGNPYTAVIPPSSTVWNALFDGLTRIAEDGSVAPALATSWELVEPTRWRFRLREGVTFSNNEPFDVEAVLGTFSYLMSDEAAGSPVANELQGIVSVTPVDPYTVDIVTETPDAILPNRLVAATIVPPVAGKELGPNGFARTPHGTGPLVLVEWDEAAGRTRAVARPESWRWQGREPNLSAIEFIELTDAAARLQALLSDQTDLSVQGPDDVPVLEAAGFKIVTGPVPQIMSLAFITEGKPDSPLASQAVRQALNYAVNKQAIADGILRGLAEPAGQGAAPMTFGYNPDVDPYPYDPEKAQAMLADAGYAEGFSMTADVIVGSAPGDALIYQAVKQDLAKVGVDLTLRPTVFPDWFRNYLGGTFKGEAFGLSWNAIPYNDAMRPMEIFSCLKTNAFFCDEELTAELQAAASEMDRDARLQKLQALQAAYHEAAPCIFLIQQTDLIAYAPRVGNVKTVNRVVVYEDLTLAE